MQLKKARTRKDYKLLTEMDRQMFPGTDAYAEEQWKETEAYIYFPFKDLPAGSFAIKRRAGLDERGDEIEDPESCFIESIGVLPQYQGRGVGFFLMGAIIAKSRIGGSERIYSNTRKSNERSLRLHKKFGFKEIGEIENYYPDGESTILLKRNS